LKVLLHTQWQQKYSELGALKKNEDERIFDEKPIISISVIITLFVTTIEEDFIDFRYSAAQKTKNSEGVDIDL